MLEAKPYDWQGSDASWQAMVDGGATFLTSLAFQLRRHALSFRQAECVAKNVFGRRVKRNADEFDALCDRLTQDAREMDASLLSVA